MSVAIQDAEAPAKPPETLQIPMLERPVAVDGRVDEAEWTGAITIATARDGRLRIAAHGERVFVGVDSVVDGIVSVYIAKGDRVTVLHASYSLGTAAYSRSADSWERIDTFKWERPEVISGKTSVAIETTFQKHRWSGTRIDTGMEGDLELVMNESLLTGTDQQEPARLAISFFDLEGDRTAWTWPERLKDDATNIELQKGETPAKLNLKTETWGVLQQCPLENKDGTANE